MKTGAKGYLPSLSRKDVGVKGVQIQIKKHYSTLQQSARRLISGSQSHRFVFGNYKMHPQRISDCGL